MMNDIAGALPEGVFHFENFETVKRQFKYHNDRFPCTLIYLN